MKGTIYDVLKRPVVTEKSTALREEENQYAFEVALDANKVEIRNAKVLTRDKSVMLEFRFY